MASGLVNWKGFGRKQTLCKALSWHFTPGRTEENQEQHKSGQLVLQRRFKPGTSSIHIYSTKTTPTCYIMTSWCAAQTKGYFFPLTISPSLFCLSQTTFKFKLTVNKLSAKQKGYERQGTLKSSFNVSWDGKLTQLWNWGKSETEELCRTTRNWN